jgi:pimeloyl-ACP methyl ester carboxylesterase
LLEKLRPQAVVGHSLGGWLAGWHAVKAADRFKSFESDFRGPKKIILANPSGVMTKKEQQQEWIDRFETARVEGIKYFRKHIFAKEPMWFKLFAAEFNQLFSKPDISKFMDSVAHEHLLNDHLSRALSDFYLLWGKHDTLVPPEWSQDWVDVSGKIPPENVIILPEAGHSPHVEATGVTLKHLHRILC